jgi:hypothetical protein
MPALSGEARRIRWLTAPYWKSRIQRQAKAATNAGIAHGRMTRLRASVRPGNVVASTSRAGSTKAAPR